MLDSCVCILLIIILDHVTYKTLYMFTHYQMLISGETMKFIIPEINKFLGFALA